MLFHIMRIMWIENGVLLSVVLPMVRQIKSRIIVAYVLCLTEYDMEKRYVGK